MANALRSRPAPAPRMHIGTSSALRALGARPMHEERVLRQCRGRAERARPCGRPKIPAASRLRTRCLLRLEAELRVLAVCGPTTPAPDGSRRLIVALGTGSTVESVATARGGLCVSSQVGLSRRSMFCMTATAASSASSARARRRPGGDGAGRLARGTKVVFMGMGEPAHTSRRVLEAIFRPARHRGLASGHQPAGCSRTGANRRAFGAIAAPAASRRRWALCLQSTDAALARAC